MDMSTIKSATKQAQRSQISLVLEDAPELGNTTPVMKDDL